MAESPGFVPVIELPAVVAAYRWRMAGVSFQHRERARRCMRIRA